MKEVHVPGCHFVDSGLLNGVDLAPPKSLSLSRRLDTEYEMKRSHGATQPRPRARPCRVDCSMKNFSMSITQELGFDFMNFPPQQTRNPQSLEVAGTPTGNNQKELKTST